jgi:hypothetical protein
MKPRDLVEISWETPLGGRKWRQAIILCVMPRLLIVQYQDGKRHCIPKEHARPVLVPRNGGQP